MNCLIYLKNNKNIVVKNVKKVFVNEYEKENFDTFYLREGLTYTFVGDHSLKINGSDILYVEKYTN